MIRFPFCFFAFALLSSLVSYSECFSTSNFPCSTRLKKKSYHTRYQRNLGIELRVAIDPTTAKNNAGGDGGHSYDFISVQEAEEALEQERARYEGERSELEWLLETQRQQLKDLMHESQEIGTNGGKPRVANPGRNRVTSASKQIVIRGAHAHVEINSMNNRRKRKRAKTAKFRERNNGTEETFNEMKQLETLLQDAIIENEKLTSWIRNQQHQQNAERNMYEGELRQEQRRLYSFRDELHMERAYFETSRRMLERRLEEEQQKVQELEAALYMLMTGEEMFPQQNISDEQHENQQNQQQAQNQHQTQQQRKKKRRRGGKNVGFTMNINDVHNPLYP